MKRCGCGWWWWCCLWVWFRLCAALVDRFISIPPADAPDQINHFKGFHQRENYTGPTMLHSLSRGGWITILHSSRTFPIIFSSSWLNLKPISLSHPRPLSLRCTSAADRETQRPVNNPKLLHCSAVILQYSGSRRKRAVPRGFDRSGDSLEEKVKCLFKKTSTESVC